MLDEVTHGVMRMCILSCLNKAFSLLYSMASPLMVVVMVSDYQLMRLIVMVL